MNAFWTQLCDLIGRTDYISMFAEPGRPILEIEPYTYVIDGNTAAISQAADTTFLTPMGGDNDFVMTYLSGFARTVANTYLLPAPALLLQISDLTSGKTFFSSRAAMPLIAGQMGFPFLLTGPRVVRARSTLQMAVRSAQIQAFNGFYFCYHGARIWYA